MYNNDFGSALATNLRGAHAPNIVKKKPMCTCVVYICNWVRVPVTVFGLAPARVCVFVCVCVCVFVCVCICACVGALVCNCLDVYWCAWCAFVVMFASA